jgi:hypothetical protein
MRLRFYVRRCELYVLVEMARDEATVDQSADYPQNP